MAKLPKFAKAEIGHIKRELSALVGGTIKSADAVYVDMHVWPFLVIELHGKKVMLQAVRDPEVNGPGAFLFKDM